MLLTSRHSEINISENCNETKSKHESENPTKNDRIDSMHTGLLPSIIELVTDQLKTVF